MMAAEWYARLMGTELGPFTSAQLLDMARKNQVTPEDVVKKGRDGEWVAAYRVKGLFQEQPRPAASTAESSQPVEPAAVSTRAAKVPAADAASARPVQAPAADAATASPQRKMAKAAAGRSRSAAPRQRAPLTQAGVADTAASAASPTNSTQEAAKRLWYFISDGEKHGPMPFATLKQHARAGDIKQTDRVWSNTCPKWSIAADVEGLEIQ